MKQYQKPVVVVNDELAEGVYAASGSNAGGSGNSTSGDNGPKCDSKYMKGVWQGPDYSDWGGQIGRASCRERV